ncbi:MAG: DNA mismatch repair endonuclease MutL [Bdellovibrionales bacterium]|nr:DNA mismatch repair endonuclease MutL [Bdellovibrionales bacterium]
MTEVRAHTASSRVRLLDPIVAERIAAGEVVERPASVVKELVENALDAGATEITVLLEDGGRGIIEVIDNGHGMGPDDLELCVKRHATSKIRAVEDLESLATLGFRGEALPSIAAVARLNVLSRPRGAEDAYEVNPDERDFAPPASKVTYGHFLGSSHGTRVRAESLFVQVPARLKFLKSPRAEVSQVREWIERLAIARPEVGFRLVSDDRTIVQLRPQDAEARARAVLDDGGNYPVVAKTQEAGSAGVKIRAVWLRGFSGPQARRLIQVVNGRAVRDRMLQQAVLSAFRQALLPGQYPAVAVWIDVDPSLLDVNVHPAKTEIRFADSGAVFGSVSRFFQDLLALEGAAAHAPGSSPAGPPAFSLTPTFAPRAQTSSPGPLPLGLTPFFASEAGMEPEGDSRSTISPFPPAHPLQGAPYVGSLFQTYLLFDLGEELGLVDQHAAHERIRFEELRGQVLGGTEAPSRQHLLIPEAIRVNRENAPALTERLPWLERMGFEAETFGEDTLLFRAVPAAWGSANLRARLANLAERLLDTDTPPAGGALTLDEALFEKLASEACHSSRRAGDRLEPAEARGLVDRLFACEHPWNCPHGRPTVVRVPATRLEEWFQRRV